MEYKDEVLELIWKFTKVLTFICIILLLILFFYING